MPELVVGLGDARSSSGPAPRDEQGAVTAEAAIVLGVLVAVAAALVWLVALTLVHGRVQDAAREAARAAARGEPESVARRLAEQVAPEGSRIEVTTSGDAIEVSVSTSVRPLGLLAGVPTITIRARAVAADEGTGRAR